MLVVKRDDHDSIDFCNFHSKLIEENVAPHEDELVPSRSLEYIPGWSIKPCPSIRLYGTRNRVSGFETKPPASGDPRTSNGAVFKKFASSDFRYFDL